MPLPDYQFGFVAIQRDTEAGTAVAGTLDETISKYEQEQRGVSAAYASPWVSVALAQLAGKLAKKGINIDCAYATMPKGAKKAVVVLATSKPSETVGA